MGKKIEVKSGDRYGRLTIVEETSRSTTKERMFFCMCDCGNKKVARLNDLRSGNTLSCGCLQKEITINRSHKHGHNNRGKRSKTYRSWAHMKERCDNSVSGDYKNYGGRGITYDPRWEKFENFLEDMGEAPEGLSIDRVDNNGNYCKENCRWATSAEQNGNKRNLFYVSVDSKKVPLISVARNRDVPYRKIYVRVASLGWSIDRALNTP